MAKYYKNLCGHKIDMALFGVGRVEIPAEAACVELRTDVADAINSMAYPNVILQEVTPIITIEDAPVVTAKRKGKPKDDVQEEQETELEDVTL